ncbi:hypothetical protein F5X99DRAFT_392533 [Biscogniauxia marginata]|nr:hypothetical protein F5X99DRAFT_392533 [Biscogniauxia marginata]
MIPAQIDQLYSESLLWKASGQAQLERKAGNGRRPKIRAADHGRTFFFFTFTKKKIFCVISIVMLLPEPEPEPEPEPFAFLLDPSQCPDCISGRRLAREERTFQFYCLPLCNGHVNDLYLEERYRAQSGEDSIRCEYPAPKAEEKV